MPYAKDRRRRGTLSAQQRAFVEYVAAGQTQTDAYLKAGYKCDPKEARSKASRLARLPDVRVAIEEATARRIAAIHGDLEAIRARENVTVERTLTELARIGFSDARRLFGPDNRLLAPTEWPDDIAAAIASFEASTVKAEDGTTTVTGLAKVKLWPKTPALNTIAQHLGMLVNRVAGADGGPVQVRAEGTMTDVELAQRIAAILISAGQGGAGADSEG